MATPGSVHISATGCINRPDEGALTPAGDSSGHADEKGNAMFTVRGDNGPKVEVRGFESSARRIRRNEAARVLVTCRPSAYRPPDRGLCFRIAAMQPMSCHV